MTRQGGGLATVGDASHDAQSERHGTTFAVPALGILVPSHELPHEDIYVAQRPISLHASGRPTSRPASNLDGGEALELRESSDVVAGLVEACRAEDRRAQRQLYEHFKGMVYRLAVRMVGRQDALDLSQQVFLRMFGKIGQYSGRSRFETWLYRLAVNECLQFRRRARRRDCALAHDPIDESAPRAAQAEDHELLERALRRIAPELRAIFVLREGEGLSYEELAGVFAISSGTVGSRLNRARAKLREELVALGWKS